MLVHLRNKQRLRNKRFVVYYAIISCVIGFVLLGSLSFLSAVYTEFYIPVDSHPNSTTRTPPEMITLIKWCDVE